MRALARALGALGFTSLACLPAPRVASAAVRPLISVGACTLTQPAVAFPDFDPLKGTDSLYTGAFSFSCLLGGSVTIALGTGSSGTFKPRTMLQGGTKLNYNFYTTSNVVSGPIWGDGTASTATVTATVGLLGSTQIPLYGDVPGSQNVPSGTYSDSVAITANFF